MREQPGAEVTWSGDGDRYSARFGDDYFSGDRLAETGHVFLAGAFEPAGSERDPAPWFAWPEPLAAGSRIAVIGSGIAGAAAARTLADAGFAVTVYEAGAEIASGASATPACVLQPRPLTGADADACFHAAAYRTAVDLFDGLEHAGHAVWRQRGLLVLGRDATDAARYRKLVEGGRLGPGAGTWLDAEEAGRRAGLAVALPGAWFAAGGALDGAAVCRALLEGIEVRLGHAVSAAEVPASADAVVLAAGFPTQALSGFAGLGLHANRGQLTRIAPIAAAHGQSAPVTYGGYMVKAGAGHLIGATFRHLDDPAVGGWRQATATDDAANLALLGERLPVLGGAMMEAKASWVGLRATTEDRMPVLGPVPDAAAFEADFGRLRHGNGAGPFPAARFRPGLYVLSGLGTRGFLTAPLAAVMLADRLAGRPLARPRAVSDALHPARFLIRRLKRSRTDA